MFFVDFLQTLSSNKFTVSNIAVKMQRKKPTELIGFGDCVEKKESMHLSDNYKRK